MQRQFCYGNTGPGREVVCEIGPVDLVEGLVVLHIVEVDRDRYDMAEVQVLFGQDRPDISQRLMDFALKAVGQLAFVVYADLAGEEKEIAGLDCCAEGAYGRDCC